MNKIVDLSRVGLKKADVSKATARKPIQDLREWLSRVEQLGELVRVRQPVDRDEEMSAISYLVAKQQPSPAVLFERPRGFDGSPIGAKMLWNILGPSVKRVALTLGGAGGHADGRIDPAGEGQAQAAPAAARGECGQGADL